MLCGHGGGGGVLAAAAPPTATAAAAPAPLGGATVMAQYGWDLADATVRKARRELNEVPERRQVALEAVREQMRTRPDVCEYAHALTCAIAGFTRVMFGRVRFTLRIWPLNPKPCKLHITT